MSGRIKLGLVGTVFLTLAMPCLAQDSKSETDLRRLREENRKLEEMLLKSNSEVTERTKQMLAMREKAVAAEIEAKILRGHLTQLTIKVEELQKEVVRLRALAKVDPAKLLPCPGPENVEGLVKEVQEKTGLLTLNIGSDSGLQKGNTMEVYRLDKVPAKSIYLGTVRIVEVRPTEAVGQMVVKPRVSVQKGDRVASMIGPLVP